MLDQLLVPLFEIISLLTFDFFDLAFIVELASGAWEWTLFVIQSLQRLILVSTEYLGHIIHFNHCLFRVLSGHVSSILDKFCHTIPRAWNETMRLCRVFYQITAPLLEYATAHLTAVIKTIFLPVFRLIFDAAYPLLCDDIPPPETRRSFWSSFSSSPSCSTEEMIQRQKECVFRISSVALTAFAAFVLGVVIMTRVCSLRTSRRSEAREVGVDRGTNTPAIGVAEPVATFPLDRGDVLATPDQFM